MAQRAGVKVARMEGPAGVSFTLGQIEAALKNHKPKAFFITHGESSTGCLQNLQGIGALCHKYNALCCVDSVAACGGVPLFMDDWEIDIMYTGSQKVVAAPPGTAPISFSERARTAIANRQSQHQSFYFDMTQLARYWNCDGQPRFYHHTGAVSNYYGLREALSEYAAEGSHKAVWDRHARCAKQLHEGLAKMGLELYVPNEADRLPTVTTIKIPEGYPWAKVNAYLMKSYALEVAGGLGPSAGQVWRVGLMGYNATQKNVAYVLEKFAEALEACKN